MCSNSAERRTGSAERRTGSAERGAERGAPNAFLNFDERFDANRKTAKKKKKHPTNPILYTHFT
jgi:hypothetical protein